MKLNSLFLMYVAFLIYSLSGIVLKIASFSPLLSISFLGYFCVAVLIMGLYAILWQQILKITDLSVAMANKPFVLILGILWANILFDEKITWNIILGGVLILLGITIIGKENE